MTFTEKIKAFFKEVYVELRKTNWLSTRQVVRYTLLVLAVTVVVAIFLGGLDYGFSTALQSIVFK